MAGPAVATTKIPRRRVAPSKSPHRETMADAAHVECGDGKIYRWGQWRRGLTPVLRPNGKWYLRDETSLNRDTGLPCGIGGVYEIRATKGASMANWRVVYVGRATKVDKEAKGSTLRERIYQGYCHDGSHLRSKLQPYLESGHEIWFRWIVVGGSTEDAIVLEKHLLGKADYAINKVLNGAVRSLVPRHETKDGRLESALDEVVALRIQIEDLREENDRLRVERNQHWEASERYRRERDALRSPVVMLPHLPLATVSKDE
jgi:hypothetical protein